MTRCPCGFAVNLDPRTAAYHRVHRAAHLAVYPGVDTETRKALDTLVAVHELREQERAA